MQSKTKNMIRIAVAFSLSSALCGAANGQEMPPACAQIVRVSEICGADVANWLDYNDPAAAAKSRESTAEGVAKFKAVMQQAAKQGKTMAAAQYCASQDLKQKIVGQLGGTLTPILFARGDVHNCTNALATLQ